LFEAHKQLGFAGSSVSVFIYDSHSGVGLLGIDSIAAASHGKDVIEKEMQFAWV